MVEIRYIRGYKDGIPLTPESYEVSDEQLADEIEAKALAKAGQLIDAITNLAEAKVFLKRLCQRLIRKGMLP